MGDDGFENFVHDRREDSFVVVRTELTVDRRKVVFVGLAQDSAGDVDHLKIWGSPSATSKTRPSAGRFPWGGEGERKSSLTLGSGEGSNVPGLGSNIVQDRSFEPGDLQEAKWWEK